MATAELKVRIDAETGQLKQGLDKADRDLKNFGNSATKSVTSFGSATSSVFKLAAASIAGALSVGAFTSFGREVFNATAQFEKFGAVLGNTLGSSALANLKLKEIQEFAEKTPFGVNELTNSFVKLANQGFKPTGDQMRLLGDLASSTGKSFDQLTEAILDAQVGEFERLKEFGIRAQDSGNKVIFTFKGVQTTVDKTSDSIRSYITDLGKAEGASGSMAVISETLSGKISNLGDSWDQMLISVGSNTSGIFSGAIEIISKAIGAVTDFNKSLEIQSRFKLKTDFGLNFQQGSLKLSDVKGEVAQVESAQKSVQKYIKSVQEIATTPEEFKKSMQGLADLAKQQIAGLNNANLSRAIVQQYVDGINTIKALAKDAGNVIPKDAGFGKNKNAPKIKVLPSKEELKIELGELFIQTSKAIQDFNFSGTLGNLKGETAKALKEGIKEPLIALPEIIRNVTNASATSQALYTPFQILKDEVQFDLLPQLGTSFKTFFDEMLIRGKFSFASLGESIKNTFLSVLASEATQGVLNLLGQKGTDGKGKGLIGSVLGLIGGKGDAKSDVGSEVVKKGLGGILGTILPAAGLAFGAISVLGGLFKKRKIEPQPAFTTSNAISTSSSSNVDFGSGRVVFEISGVNLVGVLNRAGAKLQRFGP
jgi:hypothetical protein